MKYFKLFNTSQEYYEYELSEDCVTPNICSLRDCTQTWINVEKHKYEEDYLTFRVLESATFSLSDNDVQYSLNDGETWTTLTAGSSTPTVNSGGAFQNCSSLTSITCNAATAPTIQNQTFRNVKANGTLYVSQGSSGYDVWMGTGDYYLGLYNWTKVEQ